MRNALMLIVGFLGLVAGPTLVLASPQAIAPAVMAVTITTEEPPRILSVTTTADVPHSPEGAVPVWKISLWKTLTYRIAASIDALVVGWLFTGSVFGGGMIALLNAVVSSTLYDLHEMGWNRFGPSPDEVSPVSLSLWKTISYRIISIVNVLLTGLFFTGDLFVSSILAFGNAAIDSTIYFFHELAWSYFGPPVAHDDGDGTAPDATPAAGN